jgi:hypothetical protein
LIPLKTPVSFRWTVPLTLKTRFLWVSLNTGTGINYTSRQKFLFTMSEKICVEFFCYLMKMTLKIYTEYDEKVIIYKINALRWHQQFYFVIKRFGAKAARAATVYFECSRSCINFFAQRRIRIKNDSAPQNCF